MSAMTSTLPPPTHAHDQFVVSHGKSGALGVFTAAEPMVLRRGKKVVVLTSRGVEVGVVLCPATLRQARILGAVSCGTLLRTITAGDHVKRDELRTVEQGVFETSRA